MISRRPCACLAATKAPWLRAPRRADRRDTMPRMRVIGRWGPNAEPFTMKNVPLGLLAALAVAFAGLAQPGIAAADSLTPIGDGWQRYVNSRYGTRLDFPAELFTPGEPQENGDGLRFTSGEAA